MGRKASPAITTSTGPLYLIPLKVCNIRARTVTVCGACSGSYVTDCQRDEVERAGVRCNTVAPSRLFY